ETGPIEFGPMLDLEGRTAARLQHAVERPFAARRVALREPRVGVEHVIGKRQLGDDALVLAQAVLHLARLDQGARLEVALPAGGLRPARSVVVARELQAAREHPARARPLPLLHVAER